MTMTSRLLTQAEAARVLRCHTITVWRLRKAGQLQALSGTPVRIEEHELRRFIDQKLRLAKAGADKGPGSSLMRKDTSVIKLKGRAARQERQQRHLLTLMVRGGL